MTRPWWHVTWQGMLVCALAFAVLDLYGRFYGRIRNLGYEASVAVRVVIGISFYLLYSAAIALNK